MPTLTRPPVPTARKRGTVAAWALGIGILAAYSGTFEAPFVYDDILAIPENPTIRRLWPLTDVLLPQAEGGLTVSGRPVLNLSFAINHSISSTNVWSYHVFNILVHIGSALLVLGIASRTIERWGALRQSRFQEVSERLKQNAAKALPPHESIAPALAVAALWALHPLLTQGVTYTVQRAESLMGFFYLLTLYAFIRGVDCHSLDNKSASGTRLKWLGLSVASCVLGMGTKEVMATAPLIVFLYDRTFLAGSFATAWRKRRAYYPALAATWLVLAALVLSTGGNRGGTVGIGTGVPLWAYPLTQFKSIAHYLMLALWPQPLVFEYGTFWVTRATDIAPYAAVVGPLLIGTIVALRQWPFLGFCGAWFFLILAPTSLTPGTIQMMVEHRMYLPLVAVVALIVLAIHRWLGCSALHIVVVIAISFGALTYRRNHDYRSHLALWSDTVAKRPQNPRAHDGLAEAFSEVGRIDDALTHRREAVRLLPDESTYHYNLAMTLSAADRREEAIRAYQVSLRLAPNEPRTHNNLAILLRETGDIAGALAHYAEAARLKPREALYHYNHGVALARVGRHTEAAASFETTLRFRRDYADAHFNLATALMRLMRLDEGLIHYSKALKLKPDDVEYRTTFGSALLLAKRPTEALAEFRGVLARQPDAVEAIFGAGNALAALRRNDEAVVQYEEVLRRAPRHASGHFKLANVLLDLDRIPEAVEHYTVAMQLTPNDAEAHHNLGTAFARLERWSDAQREFEMALRLKPDYADARRHLEQLKAWLGR